MGTSATKMGEVSAEPAAAGMFSPPEKQNAVVCLVLIAATLVLYNPVNSNPFINCDDDRYITENPYIRNGLSWATVKWALTSSGQGGFWHPLTWLSHALDIQLFGFNPAGHHFVSLVIHCFSVALLFLLLIGATNRLWPSIAVAALFAVHPLDVESIAWAAERKNVLSAVFFLATVGAYGWYAVQPHWKRFAAVAGLFACALASKPMAVTLPFALLLLDYWPLAHIGNSEDGSVQQAKRASNVWLIVEKIPLFAMSAAACLITVIAQRAAGATRSGADFSLGIRFQNAIVAYATYVWKLLWPTHLTPVYPHPGDTLAVWQVGLSAALLSAITALTLLSRRKYLIVGWLWFVGNLFPTIGFIQVGDQAMADRFAYIPEIGIFVMIVWGLAEFFDSRDIVPSWRIVPGTAVLIALSFVTYRQIGYWHSSYDLWSHALAVTKNNFIAEDNLGGALIQLGKEDEAYLHFESASRINPKDPMSRANLGVYDQTHNRLPEAVAQYQAAIQLTSEPRLQAQAYANLGAVYRTLGAHDQARAAFEKSLSLNPTQFNAWLGLGLLAQQEGAFEEAIAVFSRSLDIQPTSEAYQQLAQIFARTGRVPEARAAYQRAHEISPGLGAAQQATDTLPPSNR